MPSWAPQMLETIIYKWKQIGRRLVICGLRAESHFGVCVKERSEIEHCQISSSFMDHPRYQLKDHGPQST